MGSSVLFHRGRLVPWALVLALAATGCGSSDDAVGGVTSEHDPAQTATRYEPPGGAAEFESPLIVLVPGGGWTSADPAGLVPLAGALAEAGAVVFTTTYRTASEEAFFPVPAEGVACGIAYAVSAARQAGYSPSEVIVVGHSAGAHLAALVALRPSDLTSSCAYEAVAPDRVVGLAGPYDVSRAARQAINLFGPDLADPATWSDGNPFDHASARPELDFLLVHGRGDGVVPIGFTERFAAALGGAGHQVETSYPDGVDHTTIYSAEVAAPLIIQWLGLG